MKPEIKLTSEITVEYIDHMGDDSRILSAARASTRGATSADEVAFTPNELAGTINYLMKHRHGSPFEHGCLTVFVHAPIFVWREWHRHRIGFSYNEESGRYKTLDPVFYVPDADRPMLKVDGWKPGRPKFLKCKDSETVLEIHANLEKSYALAYQTYQDNLALGIDPGLARDCLPVGIYSSCWVTCNPRSIMSFLSLRTHSPEGIKSTHRWEDEQGNVQEFEYAKGNLSYPLHEIEAAARQLESIFEQCWPITYKAWIDNARIAP